MNQAKNIGVMKQNSVWHQIISIAIVCDFKTDKEI